MWGLQNLGNNTAQKSLTVDSDVGSSIPLHKLCKSMVFIKTHRRLSTTALIIMRERVRPYSHNFITVCGDSHFLLLAIVDHLMLTNLEIKLKHSHDRDR